MKTYVAALALMLFGAGCAGGTDEPSPTPSTEPATSPTTAAAPPADPPQGRCYHLSFAEALAPATPERKQRKCTQKHTAETYLVGRIDLIVDGHEIAVDSDRVQQQVSRECPAALPAYLGADPDAVRLTMIQPIWFTPTLEQADAGAEWFRCDAVVIAGDRNLQRLTGSLKGALSGEAADRFAMCGTSAPDAKDFERVTCSADHSWRAVEVVGFETRKYPGRVAAREHGQSTCEDVGADHADDPLDYQWSYEWPTKQQWRNGMNYGRCWVPVAR